VQDGEAVGVPSSPQSKMPNKIKIAQISCLASVFQGVMYGQMLKLMFFELNLMRQYSDITHKYPLFATILRQSKFKNSCRKCYSQLFGGFLN
jgi:hypothetical protein